MITYNSVKGGSIIPKILNNNYSSLWALNVTFLFHNQLNYRALIRNYKIFSSQCWLHHLHQSMLTYWSSKFSVAHLSFFFPEVEEVITWVYGDENTLASTFQKINHRFGHQLGHPKQCKDKLPYIGCQGTME